MTVRVKLMAMRTFFNNNNNNNNNNKYKLDFLFVIINNDTVQYKDSEWRSRCGDYATDYVVRGSKE
jgi:hypothetical protein